MNKQVDAAITIFDSLHNLNPNDGAIKRILERCREYSSNGFPEQWDGVERMQTK